MWFHSPSSRSMPGLGPSLTSFFDMLMVVDLDLPIQHSRDKVGRESGAEERLKDVKVRREPHLCDTVWFAVNASWCV